MDAADDWIAERAGKGDIVITADIPLASRCVKSGAEVIAPNGKPFTEASIGMTLAAQFSARLGMIGERLRAALRESGRFELVDTAPLRARLEGGPPLRTCGTCAPDAAAQLGAELALVTTVHKVSNLILSITMALREASPGGATRAVHSAEIRGNTDESWLHGLRWLLRNRLLAEQAPGRAQRLQ